MAHVSSVSNLRKSPSHSPLTVIADPITAHGQTVQHHADHAVISNGVLTIRVTADGNISFVSDVEHSIPAGWSIDLPKQRFTQADLTHGAEQHFHLEEEALYGLGQYQDGVMNRRGSSVTMIHTNTEVVVPFIVSTAGWGILWDNASHTEFNDNADSMRLWSEVADGVDYYLCYGDNVAAITAGYRLLTGAAPLAPRGFYGFIQCRRYRTAGNDRGRTQTPTTRAPQCYRARLALLGG